MRLRHITILLASALPVTAFATTGADFTGSGLGFLAIAVFVLAYALVINIVFEKTRPSN